MFSLSRSEVVVKLEGFPQSSIGAPSPMLVATEHALHVAFYGEPEDPEWNGATARMVDLNSIEEQVIFVTFERPSIHLYGPPNDEAFSGHRLATKGLEPYGAFEVLNSVWIQQLERMNAVHPRHDRARFLEGKRHLILTFHDSTFECVARGYRVEFAKGTLKQTIQGIVGGINA
jgi:hypothetical protein